MFDHLVVTGCGRSGTRYSAKVIQAFGVACSHQSVFTPETHELLDGDGWVAASSAFAAPHIEHAPESWIIVHQVRDPRRVVASMIRQRHLPGQSDTTGTRYYARYAREALHHDDLVGRGFALWLAWNRLVLRSKNHPGYVRVRLEDDPLPVLFSSLMKIPCVSMSQDALEGARRVSKTEGTTGVTSPVALERCADMRLICEVAELAHEFGYDLTY